MQRCLRSREKARRTGSRGQAGRRQFLLWRPPRIDFEDDGGIYYAAALLRLSEPVVERIAGAAHGADRILLLARVEQFAQPPDVHIHGAFVDIDVAAPDAVEQLLAAEHPARMLQKKLQQPVFGRSEIDRTARARDAALLAIKLDA